jgi:hypothetical protein
VQKEKKMGASSWNYFVPYQSDISKALKELREEVFQRGEYYQRPPYWKEMTFEDFLPPIPDLTKEEKEEYLIDFQKLQALPEPISIETLIEWNAEDGTHSIIDITEISPTPSFGTAAPLSDEELTGFFGTEKPSREMIERKKEKLDIYLQQELGRYQGEATYIIVYKDSEPYEIYFIGYSGD